MDARSHEKVLARSMSCSCCVIHEGADRYISHHATGASRFPGIESDVIIDKADMSTVAIVRRDVSRHVLDGLNSACHYHNRFG